MGKGNSQALWGCKGLQHPKEAAQLGEGKREMAKGFGRYLGRTDSGLYSTPSTFHWDVHFAFLSGQSRSGFFSLDTADIWGGGFFAVGGCPVTCMMLSRSLVVTTHWHTRMSLDSAKCLQGDQEQNHPLPPLHWEPLIGIVCLFLARGWTFDLDSSSQESDSCWMKQGHACLGLFNQEYLVLGLNL